MITFGEDLITEVREEVKKVTSASKQIGEQYEKIKGWVKSDLEKNITNKLETKQTDTDDHIRKICVEEEQNLRCAVFYPFTATVGSNQELRPQN